MPPVIYSLEKWLGKNAVDWSRAPNSFASRHEVNVADVGSQLVETYANQGDDVRGVYVAISERRGGAADATCEVQVRDMGVAVRACVCHQEIGFDVCT